MTNSTAEIPEVDVQLAQWRVTLHVYVWQYKVQVWENVATLHV